MSADRNTGTLQRSLSQIADRVQYIENNAVVIPDRKTIKRALDWMEQKGMLATAKHKGLATGQTFITISNWETYQSKEEDLPQQKDKGLATDKDTDIYNDRARLKCLNVVQEVQELKSKPQENIMNAGAFDHQQAMAFLDEISKEIGFEGKDGKPPFPFYGRLLKHYGVEPTLSIFRKFAASGKTVADVKEKRPDTTPEAYFSAAVANELERMKAGVAPEKSGFELAIAQGLCDKEGNPL